MLNRMQFENALASAVEHEELALAYQPIVSLADGRGRGSEALLRWRHSGLGPVSPGEFIPLAEESGAIIAIGEWVLTQACLQASRWSSEPDRLAHLPVHINVSARSPSPSHFSDV